MSQPPLDPINDPAAWKSVGWTLLRRGGHLFLSFLFAGSRTGLDLLPLSLSFEDLRLKA